MRELTDDEIIAARKTTPSDYSRPWGDTLAFARAILAAAQAAMPSREPTRHPCGHLIVSDECVSCAQDQSAATPSAASERADETGAAQAVTDGPAADSIADLCTRLRDATAPEYIDGRPTCSEHERMLFEAADALERLAKEKDTAMTARGLWRARHDDMADRAERAEAERDEARDGMAHYMAHDYTETKRANNAEAERDVWKGKAEMRGREGCEARAERDALRECVRAADAMRAECDQVPPMVQQRKVLHVYDAARAKVNTTEGEK